MPVILVFKGSFSQMSRLEMEGIYSCARLHGWSVQTVEYDATGVWRGRQGKRARVPDVDALLEFWRPAGCIVECAGRVSDVSRGRFRRIPTVYLDRHPSTIHQGAVCVSSDAQSIAHCAVGELLSLGFEDYAYLPWPEETVWSRERGDLFERIVKMSGKTFHSFAADTPIGDKLASRRDVGTWVLGLPRPCGVFATNDVMAERLVAACAAEGIAMPYEVAVVGVDDEEQLCENAPVTISSVRPDYEKAGFCAAELLGEMIGNPSRAVASRTFGALRLTRRTSTRLLRCADARILKALDIIRRRACEGLTPSEVAFETGISRRLLDLRFRDVTGHTVLDEIHEVRLWRVKELLSRPTQVVSAIPDLCGYSSLVDLRRVFKHRIGMTMREWQRMKHA